MKELKKNSIHVAGSVVVCWPQFGGKEEIIDLSEIGSKFNGVYNVNNSTICFVHDGIFVTPYTREAIATIEAAGLRREHDLYVPFSNWDYPKYEEAKWQYLLKLAQESHDRAYEADCVEWCNEHNIGELSAETMERCFKIPRSGVPVKHLYYEDTVYPACSETMLDCTVADKLGSYCTNNGRVVFVYRDGHTYVAKGYWIVSELEHVGYSKSGLFVPFSNGEQITDFGLASQWEALTKKK